MDVLWLMRGFFFVTVVVVVFDCYHSLFVCLFTSCLCVVSRLFVFWNENSFPDPQRFQSWLDDVSGS